MQTSLTWVGAMLLSAATAIVGQAETIEFVKKKLVQDLNEGCAIADINDDGRLDVVAGRNWYAAPDFLPRPLRLIGNYRTDYADNNGDHVHDVDGDGLPDVIAGSFMQTQVYWFRNPGRAGLDKGILWEQHLLVDTEADKNEAVFLHDLNGDRVPEWIVNCWDNWAPLVAWKLVKGKEGPTMQKLKIGSKGNGHGMAFGDVNGDGREDILVGMGWYERPAEKPFDAEWAFHSDWKLHASCPMIVVDLDGDGRNDLIWGNGHDFGLYWWQQLAPDPDGKTKWREHLIDKSWSQPHCLHWADLDGDGQEELLAGKRVRGHAGRDPGGKDPPCLYYYAWDKQALSFTRHTIDEGNVAGGLQICTGDLNGDGRLDIAVSGKSGTYVLFNQGRQ